MTPRMRNLASPFIAILFFAAGACSSMAASRPHCRLLLRPQHRQTLRPLRRVYRSFIPEIWPQGQSGVPDDPAIEARVADLLSRMTVEEKVGQTIQADLGSVTPDDVRKYRLGSILDGGSSGPHGNDRAPVQDWLSTADEFWRASMEVPAGHVAIPLLWGTDSVHGNSNIVGATIFPHNIGLGAMRDPAVHPPDR